MSCRGVLVLAIAVTAGCADDVPTLYATATALVRTDLAPPSDNIPTALGHYRWELVESPAPLHESFDVGTADLTVALPERGIYVFDRWFVGQAADQLSYHVVVTVDGVAPMATIVGSTMAGVGAATTLDGSTSSSPERRALSFQWRLAIRPASSATELADTTSPMLMLVPDVPGDYAIELRVSDGELWSQPATITLAAR